MTTTTTNNNNNNNNNKKHATSYYEEFPSPSSPSLPWFVEYWSTSFMNTPLVDQMLCPCNTDTTLRNTNTSNNMDMPSTTIPSFKLRQVLASRTLFEEEEEGGDESMMSNTMCWKYLNQTPYFPTICKSSILMDDADQDMESILDDTMNIVHDNHKEEDDDTRDAAASCSNHGSMMDDYSSRILHTCESFDQFLRGDKVSNSYGIRLQPRPREPKSYDDEALMTTTTPPLYYGQHQPTQPPPSPSATTYTTVSLTQSFLKEDSLFDHDDSDDEDIGDDTQDFMERWNHDSSKLFRGMNGNEDSDSNNPFQTPKATRKRSLVMEPPPHKTKKSWQQDDDDGHIEPYRYLIRMKPQNYMHYNIAGGMEEEKWNDDDVTEGCNSNVSSDDYSLPSHHQLSSSMTFHEAFLNKAAVLDVSGSSSTLPHMPDW
jgi:hypothetical protein